MLCRPAVCFEHPCRCVPITFNVRCARLQAPITYGNLSLLSCKHLNATARCNCNALCLRACACLLRPRAHWESLCAVGLSLTIQATSKQTNWCHACSKKHRISAKPTVCHREWYQKIHTASEGQDQIQLRPDLTLQSRKQTLKTRHAHRQ